MVIIISPYIPDILVSSTAIMLAIAASRLSPSDTWRRKDEKTKERPILGSWRERRGSKESGEEKGSGETKETLGSWRLRKRERAKAMDETGVHGDCIPAEWKLQKMYKQLKIDNNKFTTWLVESVYPCGRSLSCIETLPPCITLSRKQAKGMSKPDWAVTSNAILTTSTDHPKYDIIVNNITELARQTQKTPASMMALLDRLIVERTEYSYWMSRKSTDDLSKFSNESHVYYIEVLKEVKVILAEHIEPQTTTSSQAGSPTLSETTNIPTQTPNPTLGKRKVSSTSHQNPDRRKAMKTESTTSSPKHVLQKEAKHLTTTQRQQEKEWRHVVANSCNKMAEKDCAPVAKPMSYAAALRVAVAV